MLNLLAVMRKKGAIEKADRKMLEEKSGIFGNVKAFGFIKRHIEEIVIFISLLIIWLLFDGPVRGFHYTYTILHYLDVSIGFCSRTFIGTIVKLIAGNEVSFGFIKCFITVNLFLCMILLSVILGRIVRKNRDRPIVVALVVFSVFALCSFRYCLTDYWTSCFDHYWLSCMLLSVLCLRNKVTKWFVPLLLFVGMWIHYAFIFSYAPFIIVLIIYKLCTETEGRKSNIGLLATGVTTLGASTVYFYIFANRTLRMTLEQAWEYIASRTPTGAEINTSVLDANFYSYVVPWGYGEELTGTTGLDFISLFLKIMRPKYREGLFPEGSVLISIIPVLLCFTVFWLYIAKKAEKKSLRLVAVITAWLPLVGLASTYITTDDFRFMSFAVASQCGCVLYFLYHSETDVLGVNKAIDSLQKRSPVPVVAILIGALFVAAYAESISNDIVYSYMLGFCVFALSAYLYVSGRRKLSIAAAICYTIAEPGFAFNYMPLLVYLMVFDVVVSDEKNELGNKKNAELKSGKLLLTTLVAFAAPVAVYVGKYVFKRNYNGHFYDIHMDGVENLIKAAMIYIALLALVILTFRVTKGKKRNKAVLGFTVVACLLSAALMVAYQAKLFDREWVLRYSASLFPFVIPVASIMLPYDSIRELRDRWKKIEAENCLVAYTVVGTVLLLFSVSSITA